MSQNLVQQIQTLLTNQKCYFCRKAVPELNLAGFEHQKDFFCFLKKPICQSCWAKKSDLIRSNNQNFSPLEQIKSLNQRLQSWIKSYKDKKNNKPIKIKKEENKTFEDWQKKLSNSG